MSPCDENVTILAIIFDLPINFSRPSLAEAVRALKSLKVGHANSSLRDTKRQVLHFLKTIANPANCKDYQTGSHQRLFDILPRVIWGPFP